MVLPYPLLERVRLLATRFHGEVKDESFAADVTMTLQFPVDEVPAFQGAVQELSGGRIQGEVIDTTQVLVKIKQ